MKWSLAQSFVLAAAVHIAACGRHDRGESGTSAPAASATVPIAPVPSATGATATTASDSPDFFADRASHPTVLAVHGPSPQSHAPWPEGGPFEVVEYRSAGRTLRGLLGRPASRDLERDGKRPALVYLHGGFALDASDLRDCRPFLDAGLFVWAPALRGENGNPGDYELAFGELDDARAAIDHARTLPGVDASRIVVFGHSAGGMLSAMLALYPDLPVLDTGSAGGIYGPGLFDGLTRPFVDSPIERRMRLFAPYVERMKQPHFACVGDADLFPHRIAADTSAVAASRRLPFEMRVVTGNHFSSLPACMAAFLSRVRPKVQ
jgi:acetyl esterase/lipase